MINARIRGVWDRGMRPVGLTLARAHVSPDAITLAGVAIQGVVAYAIIEGRLLTAGLVAIASGVADLLDGAVAKARGVTSRFGAVLDSTTDRISDALFFVPLAWLYGVAPDAPRRDQTWVAAVALATLVLSFLVSYVKARAEAAGFDCNVGVVERAERLILIIAALILDLVPAVLVVLGALSLVTFIQRVQHVRRQDRDITVEPARRDS